MCCCGVSRYPPSQWRGHLPKQASIRAMRAGRPKSCPLSYTQTNTARTKWHVLSGGLSASWGLRLPRGRVASAMRGRNLAEASTARGRAARRMGAIGQRCGSRQGGRAVGATHERRATAGACWASLTPSAGPRAPIVASERQASREPAGQRATGAHRPDRAAKASCHGERGVTPAGALQAM